MRPQETTETKYNGTVEGKKYYLSINKSYTCCSYQDKCKKTWRLTSTETIWFIRDGGDKCFHLISFIRQSYTDFAPFHGYCQKELYHNSYLARSLQEMTETIFLMKFQVTYIQRWL